MPNADIVVGDVKACLEPHWDDRPVTADRLRSRIQAVIDYGIAMDGALQEIARDGLACSIN